MRKKQLSIFLYALIIIGCGIYFYYVVSESLDEDTVYDMTAAIFDHADEISAENAKGAELSLENATSGMTIPFHKGAARYYAEHGITVDTKGE